MPTPSLICHINLAKEFRGGERQTELLIRELAELGYQQRLVIRKGNSLQQRLQGLQNLSVCEAAPNPVSAAFALQGAALVHAHDGRSVYSAWLAHRLFAMPYVITRRVVNRKSKGFIRDRAYSEAKRIFAVSQAAAVEMLNFGQRADVIMDAHAAMPANASRVAELRQRFEGRKVLGHIGALDDRSKGQRTLFAVARQAVLENPDWHFVFLGDGKDRDLFLAETTDLDNVSFEGFVDNVGDYLEIFDLLVFPSREEAVGSTLLDAMRAGLAIVASRVGGIPEIIVEGRNGVLLHPDDAEGFFAAIDVLLKDEVERERVEKNNVDDAKKYSAPIMAAAYAAAYEEILS